MCSSIVRERGSVLLVVSNLPCCVPLERVEAVMPSINRKRGWRALTLMGPSQWTIEYIQLPQDVVARLGHGTPVAALEYRKRVVHFRDRGQLAATRAFIAARLRKSRAFGNYRSFLEALPSEMIAASARATVTKRLDALIATLPR